MDAVRHTAKRLTSREAAATKRVALLQGFLTQCDDYVVRNVLKRAIYIFSQPGPVDPRKASLADRAASEKRQKAINESTKQTAAHRGGRWSGAEDAVVSSADLTDEQIARVLGRTLKGVRARRRRLGVNNGGVRANLGPIA